MKRYALFALLLVSAAALFAAPAPEAESDDDTAWGFGRGHMDRGFGPGMVGDESVWNPVEITGTIGFIDEHPVLIANGKTYLIGAPMVMMYADDVQEGTKVLVRGQLIEDLSNELVEYKVDGMIMVEQAEIDGEVLSLDQFGGPAGRGGPRFGDDLGRGRGGRMPRGRW